MHKGFKETYYGKVEPQNRSVLWVRPTAKGDGAEMFVYQNDGWVPVGPLYLISQFIKSVEYNSDESILSFLNSDGEEVASVTLTNLNTIIDEAVTDASFDADSQSVTFTNSEGETVSSITLSELFSAGSGISIVGGAISVVIDPDTEAYLTLTNSGLKISGIDSRFESLESRMDTAESDIDSLESRMDTAEGEIDALQEVTTSSLVATGAYSSRYEAIYLYAADGTLLNTLDVEDLAKDGHLKSVTLDVDPSGYDAGTYLHFVFNDDADMDDIYVNVTRLINSYTGSDSIDVSSSYVISLNETYLASLMPDLIKYEDDYAAGLLIGHLLVNGTSTGVYVPYATAAQYGVMQVGDALTATNGVVSVAKSSSSEAYLFVDSDGVGVTGIDALASRLTTVETTVASDSAAVTDSLIANVEYISSQKVINFYSQSGVVLSTVDATSFLVDGMLASVTLETNPTGYDDGTYLHFVFNTDADSDDIYVNLTSFVDTYTAGDGINISDGLVISLDGDYVASLLPDLVQYIGDYSEGFLLGHLLVNGTPTYLYVPYASATSYGVAQAGYALEAEDGVFNVVKSPSSEDYLFVNSDGVGITGIDEIAARVTTLEENDADLSALKASVSTLEDEMDDAQSDIAKLTNYVDLNTDNISTLTGLVSNNLIYKVVYDSDQKAIIFYLYNGNVAYTIDATEFIKDGMVSAVELTTTNASGESGTYIKITFNTDADSDPIYLDVNTLVDIYTGSNGVTIDGYSVYLDEEYVQALIASTVTYANVSSSGLKTGTLTINGTAQSLYTQYATTSVYGVVKIGNGITVSSGTISANVTYSSTYTGMTVGTLAVGSTSTSVTLPYASASQYGLVEIGSGLNVSSGVVSINDSYITALIDEDYIEAIIDEDYIEGFITESYLTGLLDDNYVSAVSYTNTYSGVTIGSLSVTKNGSTTTTSTTLAYATASTPGLVKTGDGINVSSGVISVDDDYITGLITADYIAALGFLTEATAVSWEGTYDSSGGTSIGTLTVNGTEHEVYVPDITAAVWTEID